MGIMGFLCEAEWLSTFVMCDYNNGYWRERD